MGQGDCFRTSQTLVYTLLAFVDGLITLVAFIQLLRFSAHDRQVGWTRPKVFHSLILASNFGYTLYFVVTPLAACGNWACWSHACGFVVLAISQTLFLAIFLLLLSFWVDLCHQATDKEDEEDDEVDEVNEKLEDDDEYSSLPTSPVNVSKSNKRADKQGCWCWMPFRKLRVRGRQKFVIVAVLFICALTVAFAGLIWYGMGNNPIDSDTMAEAYSYCYAIVILFSGGGLALYGLALYTKMCKLRSGMASDDLTKVASLTVVSVVCFSVRAILIFFSDIPMRNLLVVSREKRELAAILTLLYYFIGESVPSAVVLWVMREMPRRSRVKSLAQQADRAINQGRSQSEAEQALLSQQQVVEQWIFPEAVVQNRVSSSRSHKSNAATPVAPPEVNQANAG